MEVGKQTGRGNKKVQENSPKPLETRIIIAKAANVSDNTVSRVEKIIAKATAPVLEKLRKGETSINEAYTTIRYAEKEAAREERREGNREIIKTTASPATIIGKAQFSTIVIDPPWDWGDEGDVNQLGRPVRTDPLLFPQWWMRWSVLPVITRQNIYHEVDCCIRRISSFPLKVSSQTGTAIEYHGRVLQSRPIAPRLTL